LNRLETIGENFRADKNIKPIYTKEMGGKKGEENFYKLVENNSFKNLEIGDLYLKDK